VKIAPYSDAARANADKATELLRRIQQRGFFGRGGGMNTVNGGQIVEELSFQVIVDGESFILTLGKDALAKHGIITE
jgi:hypothetical protein